MKVAHLADIHIRGLRYLDEMDYTFEKLYESLKAEKVDAVVVGGDVYHSKLTVTSEYFDCCARFFKGLTDIAPTILILGNHDLALQNRNRMDALSPVIKAIGKTVHPLYFEPNALKFKDMYFHTLSILDKKEKWPNQDTIIDGLESGKWTEDDVHIALYHGSINNSVVDTGWVSRGNQDDITIFKGFDYAMLGDIHKYQMLTPRIGYPGSLRQNNFGEDKDKGYLLWDIKSKEEYSAKRIVLPQKRYFYTITLKDPADIPEDLDIKPNCRIRVKLEKRVNISDDLKIREAIKRIYKPCSDVVTIPPKDGIKIENVKVGAEVVSQEDLRNIDVQRRLIADFYKDEKLDKEILEAIYKLDKKYNSYLDHNVSRNVIYKMKKWKWENIFSYGKNNQIDFSKISGLVGVFGKNMVGKSSIFDGFSYSVWNKINKEGANKNVDYINTRKKKCKFDTEIDFAGKTHLIQRSTARPKSKKAAPLNDINFYKKVSGKNVSLNGEKKPDTNLKIRKQFGSLDDFVTTSLSPQEGLTQFLDKKGTDKKKLFATFLDVNIFEQKYIPADKEFVKLKAKMKDYEDVDFHHLIKDHEEQIVEIQANLEKEIQLKEKGETDLQKLNDRIADLSSKMKDVSEEIGLDDIEKLMVNSQLEVDKIEARVEEIKLNEPRLAEVMEELDDAHKDAEMIAVKLAVIAEVEKDLKRMKKESVLLEQVPCDDEYPMCPFITKAHKAKAELRNFDESRLEAKDRLLVEKQEAEATIKEFETLDAERFELQNLKLKLENLKLKLDSFQRRKRSVEKTQGALKANRDIIEKIREMKDQKEQMLLAIGEYNKGVLNLSKKLGSEENELVRLRADEKMVEELRDEYVAYSLYLKAMGKNGISYRIVSSRLPLVNEEANRILSQVSDLSLLIEDNQDEKSIKLYIMGGGKGKRPCELGSGFEKTMIALALRAALWSISSLPKTPMLILDEPFVFVEEGKFGATVRMLNYLKNYFEHIFIISHNQNLKSIVDTAIYVTQGDDGFAHCDIS